MDHIGLQSHCCSLPSPGHHLDLCSYPLGLSIPSLYIFVSVVIRSAVPGNPLWNFAYLYFSMRRWFWARVCEFNFILCWKRKRSGKHRRLAKKWISKESEDTRHVTFQGYDVMQLRDDHYESLQRARKAEPPEHVGRMWNSWCANGVLGADYGLIPLDSLLLSSCVLSHSTLFHFACISWI